MELLPAFLLTGKALLRRTQERHSAGRYGAALETVEQALGKLEKRRSPYRGGAHLLKGHVLRRLKRPQEAVESLLEAHVQGSRDDNSFVFLVEALLRAGDRRSEAREVYLDYLESPPPVSAAAGSRIASRLEKLAAPDTRSKRSLNDSKRWNQKIVFAQPDLAWPLRHLGECHLRLAEPDLAMPPLERAAERDPDHRPTRRLLAYALWQGQRLDEAKALLDELIVGGRGQDLVLRAYVFRELSSPKEAARDLARAKCQQPLGNDARLVHAEALLNSGDATAAADVLEVFGDGKEPRVLILQAACERARGDTRAALNTLLRIKRSSRFGQQRAAGIVDVVVADPALPKARTALDKLSAVHRDDRYWLARGHVLLAAGDMPGALDAWLRVDQPAPAVQPSIVAVARRCMASLYERGDDKALLDVARKVMQRSSDAEEIAALLVHSFARSAAHAVADGCLPAVKPLLNGIASMPAGPARERAEALLGLVHVARAEFEDAHARFSDHTPDNGEVALAAMRCAVEVGDRSAMSAWLGRAAKGAPRAARVALACAAELGRWEEAHGLLQAAALTADDGGWQAAVLLESERHGELQQLIADRAEVCYYQAAGLLRSGEPAAAAELLAKVAKDDPLRPHCDALDAWIQIHRTREAAAAGDHDEAALRFALAVELAGEIELTSELLAGCGDAVVAVMLRSGLRHAARQVLEGKAAEAGLSDPRTCHNLAVLHLCGGAERASAGDHQGALEHWRGFITNISVPLANFTYIQEWAEDRAAAYEVELDSETMVGIEAAVLRRCEHAFGRWAEAVRNDGAAGAAETIAALPLLLRAELAGARKLRDRGGFSVDDHDDVYGGAWYLDLHGLDEPFTEFVDELGDDDGDAKSALEMLAELVGIDVDDDDDAQCPAEMAEMQKLFSPLRVASVLHADGDLDAALRWLGAAADGSNTGGESAPYFAQLGQPNPAFHDAAENFREFAQDFETALLIEKGARAIASDADKLDDGMKAWRRAMKLANKLDTTERTANKIRQIALGRAQVLNNADREPEAIKMLTKVDDLCGDDEVRGVLAMMYASVGIEAANNNHLAKAVKNLKKAHKYNSHSTPINSQYAIALMMRARDLKERDPKQAVKLIGESARLAAECAKTDPHNEEFRNLAKSTRLEHAAGLLETGEGGAEEFARLLSAFNPDNDKRLSTLHHNRGLEKLNNDDIDGALEDLEKALELEPDSDATRKMLAQALVAKAVSLAERKRNKRKVGQLMDRATELDPDDEHLQKLKLLIHLAGDAES